MDGFVTSQNLLDRYKTFREQNDLRYIRLKNSDSDNVKGGVITLGDGLEINGDTLNVTPASGGSAGGSSSTPLLPATKTRLGGVKVGNGLDVEDDGTLNVTLAGGSGSTYQNFTGATSTSNGTRGLVPAPSIGDQNKFLRGDGHWATIGGGTSTTTGGSDVANIQGALWQNVINNEPALTLRYGDYEYNYYPDKSIKMGDGESPPLTTDFVGKGCVLDTVPSVTDGELWYELTAGDPTLKMRYKNFDYCFKYNTRTYKGSYTNGLAAYISCDALPAYDTCSNSTTFVEKNIIVVDNDHSALYERGSDEPAVVPLYGKAYTALKGQTAEFKATFPVGLPTFSSTTSYSSDGWFYFSMGAVEKRTASNINLTIFPMVSLVKTSNVVKLRITVPYAKTTGEQNVWSDDAIKYANKANHLAICMSYIDKIPYIHVALNGEYILHPQLNTKSYSDKTIYIITPNTKFYITEYVAFNKLRVFDKIIWSPDSDFEPPKPEDYL